MSEGEDEGGRVGDVGEGAPGRTGAGGGGRGRAGVLRRLDAEWAALGEDPAAREACGRWAVGLPVLAGCASPADVLARVPGSPDRVLGRLLAEAAAGDALAGRVVLQALLPKVVRMAAVDRHAGVDDYLTALWCVIATYPLARRPSSVAGNLALDTLKAVRRERRPAADLATPPHVVVAVADERRGRLVGPGPGPRGTGPSAAVVLARARRHRLVDPATTELLRSVYAEGLTGESAARRHGLSPAAVRSRCSRAVRVLAGHAALLGAEG